MAPLLREPGGPARADALLSSALGPLLAMALLAAGSIGAATPQHHGKPAPPRFTVGHYVEVARRPVSHRSVEYTFVAHVTNNGAAASGVACTVRVACSGRGYDRNHHDDDDDDCDDDHKKVATQTGDHHGPPDGEPVLLDDTLTFGTVGSGKTVRSLDTFRFRQERNERIELDRFRWSCASETNQPPLANAGPDQTVVVTIRVTLDGTGSSDPDGDPLSFRWSLTSRPVGSAAVLDDPAAVHPTFVVDRPGEYQVHLVVNDGKVDSASDMVVVSTRNSVPVANAGPDQTIHPPATVTLDGSDSFDADGDRLTYAWALVEVPTDSAAALSDPAAVAPTFTPDKLGSYIARLTVHDGIAGSVPDTVTISTTNSTPVANAGPDQTVFVGSTAELDGSGSTDVDGDLLTFRWSLVSVPSGSAATLSDATAVRPTFKVDVSGTFLAQLIVNDGQSDSLADTVEIGTTNSAPVANAGPDQTAFVGGLVQLDGSASTDADRDLLSFRWRFMSVPVGSQATLLGPATVAASFTVDQPGRYVVELVVNDGALDSAPDTVAIDTLNSRPLADAGPDQAVHVGETVQLEGGASRDADGDLLVFRWSFTSLPAGSTATLSDPAASRPTFVPDLAGAYVVQLIVNDGTLDSDPDTAMVTVNVANQAPIANAGPDQTVATGATVRLDGSGSSDPDGTPLSSFSWSLLSRPAGSAATPSDPAAVAPTFVADRPGAYVAQLIVNDGALDSPPDTVTVTVQDGANLSIAFHLPSTPTNPPVGSSANFFVIVRNLGPASTTGVTARVPLPAGYAFFRVDEIHGTYDAATGNWTIGSMLPGQEAHLSLAATVNPTGPYDLTVAITGSSQPDPDLANNTATVIVTPNANADLRIEFINPPAGTFPYGAGVSLLLEVTNGGPAATTGLVVRFQVPAGLTVVGGGTNEGTYDLATGTWTIGSQLSGQRAHLDLRVTVNPTGPVGLIATITASSQPDPNLANNIAAPAPLNRPPAANAGLDQAVSTNATVALDGSGSGDPDGDPVTQQWVFAIRPGSSAATLANASTLAPSFVPDQGGRYVAQLTLTDSHGVPSAPDTATILAEVRNRPPLIRSTAVTAGAVGQAYRYDVEAIDPDAGDTLTFSLITAPVGMTIDAGTGLIEWTPAATQGGPQNVVVRVQDAGGLFATQAFTVQVSSAANQAPVAVDDAYEVRTTESLGEGTPGVLGNDTDADGTPLVATLMTPPTNGTVSLNPDGSFTYTPHVLGEGDLVFAANVNLATRVPGATEAASSTAFGGLAAFAADDDLGSSWRAGGVDPWVEVSFPQAVTVTELQVFGHRDTSLVAGGIRNTTGFFQLFDADGAELHNSGGVDLPAPNADARHTVGSMSGVRRARFTVTAFNGEAGLAEFKVIGSALVRRERFVPGNLTQLLPTAASASSVYPGNLPDFAVDDSGTNTNWYAGSNAAGQFLDLVFPVDVLVTELQTTAPSGPPEFGVGGFIACSGTFQLFDANGTVIFDSGVVNEPSVFGHAFALPVPSVAGVRRVRYTSSVCSGHPAGFSEVRVMGSAAVTTPAFSLAKKFQALLGREVHSTPIVANLTDDNGDGRIDTRDIPDIVVPVESVSDPLNGEIKVVSGDDGRELFALGNLKLVSPWSEVAVGNLDGDSVPEIVAVHSDGNHLIAFDLEGGAVQGNLTQLLTPLTLNVSTADGRFPKENAVDGNLSTSWFNLDFDTANQGGSPFFEIVFPQDVTVSELQMFGQRNFTNRSFLAGIFRLFAADGTVLFDSGVVNLPAPNRDVTLAIPDIAGVRRLRFTGTADQGGCCGTSTGIAELNVIGSAVVPTGAAKIKWISDPNPMPRFNTADGVGNPRGLHRWRRVHRQSRRPGAARDRGRGVCVRFRGSPPG